MKKIVVFVAAVIALALCAPAAPAQDLDYDGSLGNLYQHLYLQTHTGFGGARGGTGRTRRARRVTAPTTWNNNPGSSTVIRRMAATVPAANRALVRDTLIKIMGTYPAIVRAVGKQTGMTLRVTDARGAATIAGVMAFSELSGKELTNAQFAAEHRATIRSFASSSATRAEIQEGTEKYALATCLMVYLKAYADSPVNKNPDLTRQQLRGLMQDTFRTGYQDTDYTKFAATSRGIVRVSK